MEIIKRKLNGFLHQYTRIGRDFLTKDEKKEEDDDKDDEEEVDEEEEEEVEETG